MFARKAFSRFALALACAVAILALSATAALAGPAGPGPTLSVDQLQSALDANDGMLNGYLKTVVKGSTIVTIPVEVLAVTTGYGTGPVDMSSLILFRATGPIIDEIKGIASGMSGSPIYVDDGPTFGMIGALSYGDAFTTGGTGLATPIEAMMAIREKYAPISLPSALSEPVILDGEVKNRVVITQDPASFTSAPKGTIVAQPLGAVFIGGVNPTSNMYKAYAKSLASRGVAVAPLAAGLSAKESTYNAPFTPGSAVAVLAARGDLWAGGIGTVTYTQGADVLAFGHPMMQDGDSGLYLCNAWIDGIWPSTYSPYKLGRPAAVRGTLTQDRLAGIMGVDGQMTEDVPVTATARYGSEVATSAVYLPRFVADSSADNYYGIAAFSAYIAGSRLSRLDAIESPGSAVTTTTIVVSDGATTYTLVRRNVYSDAWDISMAVVSDVDDMVSEFQYANDNGIAHAEIQSIALESEFSAAQREAEVVDVTVDGGVRSGDNTATVSLHVYGEVATQTVEMPFVVPADVPPTGELNVSAVNGSYEEDYSEDLFDEYGYESSIDRRTVADVVDELSDTVDNTVLTLSFAPEDLSDSEEETLSIDYATIETTQATGWVVYSSITKAAPLFTAYSYGAGFLSYGHTGEIACSIDGMEGRGLVVGSDGTTATVDWGTGTYTTVPLYQNTSVDLTFLGNEDTLPAVLDTPVDLGVKARVSCATSKSTPKHGTTVTLTANVLPAATGGRVAFQRLKGSRWVTLKTVSVGATGRATYRYKPASAGTVKVRARFTGSAMNMSNNSSAVTLRVK
ncbi:MAG: Ig-like domain repeat protein [Coriobacteriia bacterium]|nr:Ig-like domain repeat protein [Coriobacteriia bacterium]